MIEKKHVKLSIIIVNWNNKHLIDECLKSIYNIKNKHDFEIIIYDNNSLDGSTDLIETNYPLVNLIKGDSNLGFAKANNHAIKLANGEYILLLNSDTLIEQADFFDIIEEFNDYNIGLFSPVILNSDKTTQHPAYLEFPSVGYEFVNSLPKKILNLFKFTNYYFTYDINHRYEVSHICGCCMFIRKKVIDELGFLFDESFVFSYEDLDLCKRVKDLGYKIMHIPNKRVIHFGGGSRKVFNPLLIETMLKSQFNYYFKHENNFLIGKIWLILILRNLLYCLLSFRFIAQFGNFRNSFYTCLYTLKLLLLLKF